MHMHMGSTGTNAKESCFFLVMAEDRFTLARGSDRGQAEKRAEMLARLKRVSARRFGRRGHSTARLRAAMTRRKQMRVINSQERCPPSMHCIGRAGNWSVKLPARAAEIVGMGLSVKCGPTGSDSERRTPQRIGSRYA